MLALAVVCAASPGLRAAEADQLARQQEGALARAREEVRSLQAQAAMAPAGLAEVWGHRLAAQKRVVESFEKALEAARAGDAPRTQELGRKASAWQSWGYRLQGWLHQESEALRLGEPAAGADPKEADCRRRMQAAREEVRKVYAAAAARAGDLEPAALEEMIRPADARLRGLSMLQEIMYALSARKDLLRQRDGAADEKLRAMFDERLKLQDELAALAERRAAAAEAGDGKAANELEQARGKVHAAIRDWDEKYRERERGLRDEKALAEAPPALRPLVREMIESRAQAGRLRAEARKIEGGDRWAERRRLEGRAEALNARAESLENIIEVRRDAAKLLQEAEPVKGNPRVKGLLAGLEAMLDNYEKMARETARLAEAAAELEARREEREEAAERFTQKIDDVQDKLADAVEEAKDLKEKGGDPADPAAAREAAAKLAGTLKAFDGEFGNLRKTAAVHVDMVRGPLEEASKRAAEAAKLAEAGKAQEAGTEAAASRAALGAYEKAKPFLEERVEIEEETAGLKAEARDAAFNEALAAARRLSEEATARAIEAERAVAAGDAEMVAALEKTAAATAAAKQAAANVRRLIEKAKPQPENPAPKVQPGPRPPREPEVF